MTQLRFGLLAVSSYAGISKDSKAQIEYPKKFSPEKFKNADPDNGVVIVFPEGYGATILDGNQGTGKTSLLSAIAEMCGMEPVKNAVNSKDDDKKLKSEFTGKDGNRYKLSITKTGVSLEQILLDEVGDPLLDQKGKPQVRKVSSPKSMLAELVGPAGVSPMWLKAVDGAEQIKWLRKAMVLNNKVVELENDVIPKIKTTEENRKEQGRTHKQLQAILSKNEYFNQYEKWDVFFKNPPKIEELKLAEQKASEKFQEYTKHKNGLAQLKETKARSEQRIQSINEQIELLLKQKEQEEMSLNQINDRIEKGELIVKDGEKSEEELKVASEAAKTAHLFEEQKKAWEEILKMKADSDHASDQYILLTGKLDELRALKAKIVAEFTPEVEGLEVCIPDAEDTREGLYYNKKPLVQLSESELWEMCTQLWIKLNIRVVLVEDISSLGTGAIEKFNEFIKNGGYVFAAMMNRKQNNLRVSFSTKID